MAVIPSKPTDIDVNSPQRIMFGEIAPQFRAGYATIKNLINWLISVIGAKALAGGTDLSTQIDSKVSTADLKNDATASKPIAYDANGDVGFRAVKSYTNKTAPTSVGANEIAMYGKSNGRWNYRSANGEFGIAEDFMTRKDPSSVAYCNGSDSYVQIPHNAKLNFGTGNFSVIADMWLGDGSVSNSFINKYDGVSGLYIWQNGGKIRSTVKDTAGNAGFSETVGQFVDKDMVYGFVKNGMSDSGFVTYIDGLPIPDAKGGVTLTASPDNAAVLSLGFFPNGTAYKTSAYRKFRLFNCALTPAEMALCSFGHVPFYLQDADNTNMLLNGNFETGINSDNWVLNGVGTVAIYNDTNVDRTGTYNLKFEATNISYPGIAKSGFLTKGKKYRITFSAKATAQSRAITLNGSTSVTITTTMASYSVEFIASSTALSFSIGATNVTDTVILDNISVVRLGCVLDLLPENISSFGWADATSNKMQCTFVGNVASTPNVGVVPRLDGSLYNLGAAARMAEDFMAAKQVPSLYIASSATCSVADTSRTTDRVNFGTGTFTIITEQIFRPSVVSRAKVYKYSYSAGFQITHSTANKVTAFVGDGTNVFGMTSSFALSDGAHHKIGIIIGIDAASSKLVVDGLEDIFAVKSGTFPTLTKNVAFPLYVGGTGSGDGTTNELRNYRHFNCALTVAETVQYMYQDMPYELVGGAITDLTAGNGSFATDNTSWWAKNLTDATFAWNSGTTDATYTVGATTTGTSGIYKDLPLVVGKRYRITFKAKSVNSTHVPTPSGDSVAPWNAVKAPALTTAYQEYIYEGKAQGTRLLIRLGTNLATGVSITVDEIVVQQIGCTLDFQADSVSPLRWNDRISRDISLVWPSTSFMSALPAAQEANLRYMDITGNITAVIPKGYCLDKVYIKNTSVNAVLGGIRIGTTSGNTDVLLVSTIGAGYNDVIDSAAAGLTKKMFLQGDTQDTTLYVQAVTAWNSASVDFVFVIRRIA